MTIPAEWGNLAAVDRMLAHLMENGLHVDGGDKLGKTIIFARNNAHAKFIAERFDHHYPEYDGHFARMITYQVNYAQSLIEAFDKPGKLLGSLYRRSNRGNDLCPGSWIIRLGLYHRGTFVDAPGRLIENSKEAHWPACCISLFPTAGNHCQEDT